MRSFATLLACIGCIAWAHSYDYRLLGVKSAVNAENPAQLPVDVATVPAPSLNTSAPTVIQPLQVTPEIKSKMPAIASSRNRGKHVRKAKPHRLLGDSLLNNIAVVRRSGLLLENLNP
ncbi:MAG TPA: hypothetical protein VM802_26805 [Chitinophaga sp.]|uniref:hypothetical protein n=1 Tax=Chitinophaga sp. TaxID=1869181 RepID=UPI002D0D84D9|nr:hypothetical protein [Chitinophaga sp.]HVI48507.1 hypothetical protein [Chitinophaga sp.]